MRIYKILLLPFILIGLATQINAQNTSSFPITDFLGYTELREIKVSPSGQHIALVTARNDFNKDRSDVAIWRIDIDENYNESEKIRLTYVDGYYFDLRWSPDSRYLAFLSNRGPIETSQLYILDILGGEPTMITDPGQFTEGIYAYDWLPDGEGFVIVTPEILNEKNEKVYKEFYGDVLRFAKQIQRTTFWRLASSGLQKDKAQLMTTVNRNVVEIALSPSGKQIAYISGSSTKPEIFWDSFSDTEIFLLSTETNAQPQQLTKTLIHKARLQWSQDGRSLYITGITSYDLERSLWSQGKLFRIDLNNGKVENLASEFIGDFCPFFGSAPYIQLPDQTILAIARVSTRQNIYAVNLDNLKSTAVTHFRGKVMHLSASRNGKLIAFALVTRESFPELYIAAAVEALPKPKRITNFNAKLDQMPMPEVETIRWDNGEGDIIEGVLYWPSDKYKSENLPLIVDLHGGPPDPQTEAIVFNEYYDHEYYPALLASRGYLAFDPNYRGSTGRGDAFMHAIDGYASSGPAIDILSGIDFLIKQGWVDPDKIGVMGYSYGGVLTSYLITRTKRFKAACVGAGIWNWISFFGTSDMGYIFADAIFKGNSPWENFKTYWEESGISQTNNIQTPTLITHGGSDRRVPTTQSLELYRALTRLGIPTELLIFPGEGHAFQKPSHKLTKVRAEISWLDHFLLDKPRPEFKK
ncbi:MAG: S9 family peptidase [bacterium]